MLYIIHVMWNATVQILGCQVDSYTVIEDLQAYFILFEMIKLGPGTYTIYT